MKINDQVLVKDGKVIARVTHMDTDGRGNRINSYVSVDGVISLLSSVEGKIHVDKLLADTYQRVIDLTNKYNELYQKTQDITRGEIEEAVEESKDVSPFCGDCNFLCLTEKEQEKHGLQKRPHFCQKYKGRVYHGSHHPKLVKLSTCIQDNKPIELRENMK
jgi:hypothetical protein